MASWRRSRGHTVQVSSSAGAHPWDEDKRKVTYEGARFDVKVPNVCNYRVTPLDRLFFLFQYVGCAVVQSPRGVEVCRKAVECLPYVSGHWFLPNYALPYPTPKPPPP